MKRLHITVEGQTEEAFVNKTLKVYLARFGVFADARCVLTGKRGSREFRGGVTSYSAVKNDINRWLREEQKNQDVFFTTMFDYYALPDDFPGYEAATRLNNPYEKVACIESAFRLDIGDRRFIPYIQLHEFETLLFVQPQKLEIEFFDQDVDIAQLEAIAAEFCNPELINQGRETSPSKRIINVFSGYANNKPVIGSMVAHEIGVEAMKESCRHFCDWVTKLEQLVG